MKIRILEIGICELPFDLAPANEPVEPFVIWYLLFVIFGLFGEVIIRFKSGIVLCWLLMTTIMLGSTEFPHSKDYLPPFLAPGR